MDKICEVCNGTDWESVEEEGIKKVKRCQCFYEKRRISLLETARIPARYKECSFNSFNIDQSDQNDFGLDPYRTQISIQWAKEASESYARQFSLAKDDQKGLLFMGPCGIGKTHLAIAIIRDLICKKGIQCLFYDFRDLLKEIQRSYKKEDSLITESSVLEPILETQVLLLDELGTARVTDWMMDMLTYILNQRYIDKLQTIITTNWLDVPSREGTLEDRIGPRLRSRLYEMCKLYEIAGQDYRKKSAGIF